jgi:hemoglobin
MKLRSCVATGVSMLVVLSVSAGLRLSAAAADDALYDRLGGQPAVQAVASGLVDRILRDDRVNSWFAFTASSEANTAAYKAKLYTFICQATGGPCQYTGRDMVSAHKGRAVTGAAFDAVVQDLVAVLDSLKVPEKEKAQVLGLLGPLKTSIVQAPAPPPGEAR